MVNKSFGVKTLQNPRGVLLTTEATVLHAFASYKAKGICFRYRSAVIGWFLKALWW
jgi:hypothetical protein